MLYRTTVLQAIRITYTIYICIVQHEMKLFTKLRASRVFGSVGREVVTEPCATARQDDAFADGVDWWRHAVDKIYYL